MYCIRCQICGEDISTPSGGVTDILFCDRCRNRLFIMLYPEEYDKIRFTPAEVTSIVCQAGQSDTKRFKLGDTIMYSPYEVKKILEKYIDEHG